MKRGCDEIEDAASVPELAELTESETDTESCEEEDVGDPPTQVVSTPHKIAPFPLLAESPVVGPRRVARMKRKKKRLNISSEGAVNVPHEPNARTEAKWVKKLAALLRFVDDGFALSKLNFENSYGFEVNGIRFRVKHAAQSQNIFRHLVRKAEEIGMVVNTKKTAMMCVSDAMGYKADAFMLDAEQERIECQDSLKVLGMKFGCRPTMEAQVDFVKKKFRARYWMLRNLKSNGFTAEELLKVYKTMIRPVAEYGAVVYHSSLTDEQDEELDNLQNHALKCIYGTGLSGRKMRSLAGLQTLRARREELCDKFASKCVNIDRMKKWFPRKTARASGRLKGEVFLEKKARCSRLHNSPFFYFRRRLNGKEGKKYGKRYAEYREDAEERTRNA